MVGDTDSFILGLKWRVEPRSYCKVRESYCWSERDIAEAVQVPYDLVYDLKDTECGRVDPWKGREVNSN